MLIVPLAETYPPPHVRLGQIENLLSRIVPYVLLASAEPGHYYETPYGNEVKHHFTINLPSVVLFSVMSKGRLIATMFYPDPAFCDLFNTSPDSNVRDDFKLNNPTYVEFIRFLASFFLKYKYSDQSIKEILGFQTPDRCPTNSEIVLAYKIMNNLEAECYTHSPKPLSPRFTEYNFVAYIDRVKYRLHLNPFTLKKKWYIRPLRS